jgi:GDPmannose 4,6-dehydratase
VPNALVTGITGQDGMHLTELLLQKQYNVIGLLNGQRSQNADIFIKKFPQVKLINGDLTDFSSLLNLVQESQPNEIYNLAAISFVGFSFSQPELTANVTGLGVLRLLEAVKKIGSEKEVRIYQAGSSEMFGKVLATPQNESTPFYPRSPYGVAKTFAHYTSINYREAYGMHISNGILFNHEGPYRGIEFVTRKISKNIAKIKLGKISKFSLGSLEPRRDWGYAGDYVEAMWLMLQQTHPSDYVIATGISHSVRQFVQKAIHHSGLGGEISDYIDFDPKQVRPSEVDVLIGDYSKANQILGWKPKVDFDLLVKIMVDNDLNIESNAS